MSFDAAHGWDVVGVGANSVDYVYRLPASPAPDGPHAKMPISSFGISFGGQTATTLATCAALGLRSAYIGTVGGDDNGRRMLRELERHGIDVAHAVVRDAASPFAVILVAEPHGERIVLWHRGEALALAGDELPRDVLRQARVVHVDDVDQEAAIDAARVARDAGAIVTSDIDRLTPRTEDLVASVTIPMFAEQIPAALTGETDPVLALRALRQPHHRMLCVTLGSRGAIAVDEDTVHRAGGFAVEAVDTTAAGDVWRGAFIAALLEGLPCEEVLRFANAAAAVSCTRRGAIDSVPDRAAIRRLLDGA